ncbi:DUF4377 domain-containing protein [Pedobacter cryoconitis]|uniref:DUF4377 domain-containing protein n=1 Tax=Pedobacter cryoconitis TaxID=188932 RepID=UPI00161D5B73|nr:DUF4377 domain-containing protein [Pedobacter cryoconitis]MBB5643994.1 hypothetical protein [Pedobacter cryoconitis]
MKKNLQKYYLMFLISIFFTGLISCKKDTDTTRIAIFNVAPTLAYSGPPPPASPTEGALPMLKVTEKGTADTVLIYKERIAGFTYEEGYKYSLKVQVTHLVSPPADGHSENYQLIEILSKEKSN